MPSQSATGYRIHPLRRGDRPAVREVCATTAWLGEPSPQRVPDGWLWAEYWTRYFTDRERRNSWVAEDTATGRLAGYLTGTSDVRRFDRYAPFLFPGILLRVVRKRLIRRPASRRAVLGLLRSIAMGELALPPGVKATCPATLHVNLLPEARRRGLGLRMFRKFLSQMRSLGVGGIHVQTLSVNVPIRRFIERAEFKLVHARPLHAFVHLDGQSIDILTWVLPLRRRPCR